MLYPKRFVSCGSSGHHKRCLQECPAIHRHAPSLEQHVQVPTWIYTWLTSPILWVSWCDCFIIDLFLLWCFLFVSFNISLCPFFIPPAQSILSKGDFFFFIWGYSPALKRPQTTSQQTIRTNPWIDGKIYRRLDKIIDISDTRPMFFCSFSS